MIAKLISLYETQFQKLGVEISVQEFLDMVATGGPAGKYIPQIKEIRRLAEEEEAESDAEKKKYLAKAKKQKKDTLPCVTIAGTFATKTEDGLQDPSGLMAVDFDHLGPDFDHIRKELERDPHTFAIFRSVSGKGLCVLVRVDPSRWSQAFDGLKAYYADKYGIVMAFDRACRNINRLRYLSYDPDIVVRPKQSVLFKQYPTAKQRKAEAKPIGTFIHTGRDIDHLFQQLNDRGIDLTGNYEEWYKIGWSLISEYGEAARDMFHQVSRWHPEYNYNECDKKFKYLTQTNPHTVTIAYFYARCKQAGLDIMTPRTKEIVSVAAMCKKQHSSEKSAQDHLAKMHGIPAEESAPIIAQVFASKEEVDTEETLLEQAVLFIKRNHPIRRNEITGRIEFDDGRIVKQRDKNTIYIQAKKVLGEKLTFADLDRVIDSDLTPSYNPILQFFRTNISQRPSGPIKALAETIKSDMGLGAGEFFPDYVEYFLRKWLVGLVQSAHGKYSPLVLVLAGPQNTGKTEFFRRLLPEELASFYGETKFDKGKDDEIAMCRKWILMNDEFTGKTVVDNELFKQLSSKQIVTVREPYMPMAEDLLRIACLCGTSNSKHILSDPTGNRRILPIYLSGIDFDGYNAIDKTEVLMEAYHAWKGGETPYLTNDVIARLNDVTKDFEVIDLEAQLVLNAYTLPPSPDHINAEWKPIATILTEIQGMTKQSININRLSAQLEKLGFHRQRKKRGGRQIIGFFVMDPKFEH